MDIVEKMRSFESDHEPDGWPAVQMKQVSALCDEIDRLRAQLKAVEEQEPVGYTSQSSLNVVKMGLGIGNFVDEQLAEFPVPIFAAPVPAQQSPAVSVPEPVIADIKELIDFANQNSVAGSVTIPRNQVVEYLQLLIDVGTTQSPRIAEQKLNKPARVNSTNFMTGVPVRMVVEAAQRYYDYRRENPPEKDGELQQKFLAAIDSAKRQRITEQESAEIILSFYWFMENFKNKNGRNPSFIEWYEAEGRALLNKLNGDKNGK